MSIPVVCSARAESSTIVSLTAVFHRFQLDHPSGGSRPRPLSSAVALLGSSTSSSAGSFIAAAGRSRAHAASATSSAWKLGEFQIALGSEYLVQY